MKLIMEWRHRRPAVYSRWRGPVYILSPRKILNRQSVTLFPEDTGKDVKQTPANPRNAPTKERKRHAVQHSLRIHLHLSSALDPQARWSSRESLRFPFLPPPPCLSRSLQEATVGRVCLGPCNQSFNSYCTRKRIIRRCCVLYDGSRNTHRSSASKMTTRRGARVCTTEQRPAENVRRSLSLLFTPTPSSSGNKWPDPPISLRENPPSISLIAPLIKIENKSFSFSLSLSSWFFYLMNFNSRPLLYIYFSKLTTIFTTAYLTIYFYDRLREMLKKKSWIFHANWHNRGNWFRVLTVMETPLLRVARGAASTAC